MAGRNWSKRHNLVSLFDSRNFWGCGCVLKGDEAVWKAFIMRDLTGLLALFVAAVVVGLLVHPLASIAFLLLAKVMALFWQAAAPAFWQAYRAEMARRPKRKHILTDDGEVLNVVVDEAGDSLKGRRL